MEAQLERSTCYQELVENDLPITFQFVGDKELICQRSKVLDVLRLSEDDESDTTEGVCAVTGKVEEIAQKHSKTPIPGSKSNAKLVSFNDPAYISFGKKQSLNASIGKCAAFAYTTALNHLLLRRIQVGDASTVFWSEKHTDLEDTFADLFDEPPKDDPAKQTRAIEALFKAPQTGALSDEGGKTRFYVLGLAPNAARTSRARARVVPAGGALRQAGAHLFPGGDGIAGERLLAWQRAPAAQRRRANRCVVDLAGGTGLARAAGPA